MKRYLYRLTAFFSLICLVSTGCAIKGINPVSSTVESYPTSSVTAVLIPSPEFAITSTLLPAEIFTPTPYQVVLPSITMSSQESENGLLKLLNTNGNCTGKCIAGIQPDTMTIQDAVDKMAGWGMVEVYENPRNGKTFVNLAQNPLNGQVNVRLSVGTWIKKMITIDNVSMRISGPPGDLFLGEDVWLANYDNWQGIRLDNILKAYGIPSYIGYFFQTIDLGIPLEGRNISYTLVMQYEEINLEVISGELAYYDGKSLSICPSKDPHDLGIDINPEHTLKKSREYASVTWQALTGADLNAFYQTFTSENAFDACVTTNLEKIQTLQPSFR